MGVESKGLLFAVALNPVLAQFKASIEVKSLGIVWACADDIGMCLRSLRYLTVVYNVFKDARKYTLLPLKPPICVITPI